MPTRPSRISAKKTAFQRYAAGVARTYLFRRKVLPPPSPPFPTRDAMASPFLAGMGMSIELLGAIVAADTANTLLGHPNSELRPLFVTRFGVPIQDILDGTSVHPAFLHVGIGALRNYLIAHPLIRRRDAVETQLLSVLTISTED